MADVADAFNDTFREYNVDGVPASGAHAPEKADAKALGALLEAFFAPKRPTIVTLAGAAQSLALAHEFAWLEVSHGSDVTFTIPAQATVAFPDGFTAQGAQAGDGAVTFEAAVGVTLHVAENLDVVTAAKGAVWGLQRIDDNVWRVFGNLVAA